MLSKLIVAKGKLVRAAELKLWRFTLSHFLHQPQNTF